MKLDAPTCKWHSCEISIYTNIINCRNGCDITERGATEAENVMEWK